MSIQYVVTTDFGSNKKGDVLQTADQSRIDGNFVVPVDTGWARSEKPAKPATITAESP